MGQVRFGWLELLSSLMLVLACAAEPSGSSDSDGDGTGGTGTGVGGSAAGAGTGDTGVGGIGAPGTGGAVQTGGTGTGPTDGGLNQTTCDLPEVAWIGPPSDPNMITDMEITGQEFQPPVTSTGSVTGRWHTFNDGTSANQTPLSGAVFVTARICPARNEYSVRGAHTWGSGFTDYGAGEGFWINKPSADEPLPYDASTFSGISFWVAGDAPSLRVRIVSWHDSTACTSEECNRHSAPVSVSAGWTQYVLAWSEFTHEVGSGATVNPAQLYGVEFLVPGMPSGNTFDFWVDDVAFF